MRTLSLVLGVSSILACSSSTDTPIYTPTDGDGLTATPSIPPEGRHMLTPHLVVKDIPTMQAFYANVFGGTNGLEVKLPNGQLAHAEVKVGDSTIMLAPEWGGMKAPTTPGATAGHLWIYVNDVDAAVVKAVAAGGMKAAEPVDGWWGDRFAVVIDPAGYPLSIATHKEALTPEQMTQRLALVQAEKPWNTVAATPAKNYIPDGWSAVTVGLHMTDALAAIDFYKEKLGATLVSPPVLRKDGKCQHALLKVGNSFLMLMEEDDKMKSPKTLGGSTMSIVTYTKDVDATFKSIIDVGGKAVYPIEDTFWGERYGQLVDPYGHKWGLSTPKKTLTADQIQANFDAYIKKTHGSMVADPSVKIPDGFGDNVKALMEAANALVAANGQDCTKLVPAGAKLFQDNGDTFKLMNKTSEHAEAKKWQEDNAELVKSFRGNMGTLMGCMKPGDELSKVMESLGAGM